MKSLLALLLCALGGLSACGHPVGTDAGSPDTDSGAPDAGAADAGAPTIRFFVDGGEVSSVSLYDAVAVEVSGLPAGTPMALISTMAPWSSLATFAAQADGTVNTGRDAPGTGSSWSGIDIDGPFWSMSTTTFVYSMSLDVAFQALVDGNTVATRTLKRFDFPDGMTTLIPDGGSFTVPDGGSFVGMFFVPPGPGPWPAIIAFGGSEGGISGGLASAGELVPMGYAVLAIAYFGQKGVPQYLESIPLEYFDGALAWLKQRPEIDPSRLGVNGMSRGGELSLILAVRWPELKAVVADVPSAYSWGGASLSEVPTWTSGGQPVPWIHWHGRMADPVSEPGGGTAYSQRAVYFDDLAKSTPDELDAGRTRVENAGASIAMFAAGGDALWPSCPFAQVAMDALVASGHSATHTDFIDCYPDAGHAMQGVGLPTTQSRFFPTEFGDEDLGGTPDSDAHAGRVRHDELRTFLEKTLGH
jgi:hypothetical protein